MKTGTNESASWQTWVLGIAAVVIAGGLIGLTSTLIGLRSDIDVVKNDLQYMKKQLDAADSFREKFGEKLNDHEVRLQKIESDNTRSHR